MNTRTATTALVSLALLVGSTALAANSAMNLTTRVADDADAK